MKRFLMVVLLMGASGAVGFASRGDGAPLHSSVFPPDTGVVRRGPTAVFRQLVDTATTNLRKLEMHVTTLPPGGYPHAPHRHPWEEILVVERGQLDVLQEGVTRRAVAGAVIYQASNELHGLRNPGPDSATYVVIRLDPHDLPPGGETR
jgi:quercetin dioxygenase-like cupin family protein